MKDLIILGNGMAGMTAALYAKRANLDFKIVSRDEFAFGQIGSAVLVENYPCINKTTGYDLAMRLHDQLEENKIDIEEHEIEEVAELKEGGFAVKYSDGTEEYARTIIYALGAKHKELPCSIEKDIPIHHCALCDGALYKNKNAAIIGGGDSAFTQAEYLSKICKSVFIITCDKQITAAPAIWQRVLKISNISIDTSCFVEKIYKTENNEICIHAKQVEPMLFGEDILRGRDWIFKDMGIFVAIGMIPNTEPIYNCNIKDNNGYIIANESCASSVPGFFAAGDCRTKAVRQVITAAADGANAVDSVIKYLKENS